MDSIMKADIFFFVATIGVVVFVVLAIFIGYYTIKILKNVRESTDTLKGEVKAAGQRIGEIEKEITDSFIFKFIFAKRNGKK
jgi:cell division protein FtsL